MLVLCREELGVVKTMAICIMKRKKKDEKRKNKPVKKNYGRRSKQSRRKQRVEQLLDGRRTLAIPVYWQCMGRDFSGSGLKQHLYGIPNSYYPKQGFFCEGFAFSLK